MSSPPPYAQTPIGAAVHLRSTLRRHRPKTIVNLVRDAIAENDFKKAEKLVLDDMAANGTTPIAIEAFSWLGRGARGREAL